VYLGVRERLTGERIHYGSMRGAIGGRGLAKAETRRKKQDQEGTQSCNSRTALLVYPDTAASRIRVRAAEIDIALVEKTLFATLKRSGRAETSKDK
jgi:hypothetical protein